MKIAYFTDTYIPEVNGIANTLSKLGTFLDGKEVQQLVFAPQCNKDDQLQYSEYRKVCRFKGFIHYLAPNNHLAFPPFWEINAICDDFKPDLIHVVTEFGIGFRGLRYALSRKIPLVMSYHTDWCRYLKHHKLDLFLPIVRSYLAWFFSFPLRTMVPSNYTLNELTGKKYPRLKMWSRGVDTARFNPKYRNEELRNILGKGKFIFLYAGRLSYEKNLGMLLHAADIIERRYPGRAVFVFTGDGPFAKKIQKCSLPNVISTGSKRDMELSEMYASADCFAFPSGSETFGNVVLEALASGLPVAGVANGGVTDFLVNQQNSLLCKDEDAEAFTDNLILMMNDQGLRFRLAKGAEETVRSRDWNSTFEGLLDTYNTVIRESRPVDNER